MSPHTVLVALVCMLLACSDAAPDANTLPTVDNPGDQNQEEGETTALQVIATDANGDELVFSATGLPPGLVMDTNSGLISGVIGTDSAASSPYDVNVGVTDGYGSTMIEFRWTIELGPIVLVPGAVFVASDGDDANLGTESAPWATIHYALGQLSAGDTLYVRGGTYWESSLSTDLVGSADQPIAILNYPRESPIIDGGLRVFREVGNSDWELVDASIQLFRSVSTYDLVDVAGKFEDQDELHSLSRYEAMSDLIATNEFVGTGARYVGPGVLFDAASSRIFIRLQPSSAESLNGVSFDVPTNTDPRQIRLFLNDKTTGITFENASHIVFSGIHLANHYHGFELSAADHITLSKLSIAMNYIGIRMEDGSHHARIDSVDVNAFFPPWVAWTDMKGSDNQYQPVPDIKPSGMSGTGTPLIHDIEILNCHFNGVFDGHVFDAYNINIHHNTYTVRDDMAQVGTNSYEVEIHHNLIIGPGISHNGRGDSSAAPGTKYIHHNIIDSTPAMLWGRHDPDGMLRPAYSGWHGQTPFPTHTGSGPGDGDPWKIYHNTVLYDGTGHSGGTGHELWKSINDTGEAHEVYNNIFVQTTDNPIVDDQSTTDGLQIYDGNLYYRASGTKPLFENISDSSGSLDFLSLSEFLGSSTFIESQSMYAPGWDSSSVQADPELGDPSGGDYRPSAGGPAALGALDITSLGFPGLKGDVFRGATDPEGLESVGAPN